MWHDKPLKFNMKNSSASKDIGIEDSNFKASWMMFLSSREDQNLHLIHCFDKLFKVVLAFKFLQYLLLVWMVG